MEKGDVRSIADATDFVYKGISLFSHSVGDKYAVSEKTTGLQISVSTRSDKDAIKKAEYCIEKRSVDGIKRLTYNALKVYGILNKSPPKLQSNLMEI